MIILGAVPSQVQNLGNKVSDKKTAALTLTCNRYSSVFFLNVPISKLYLGSISAFLERIIHLIHRHHQACFHRFAPWLLEILNVDKYPDGSAI